MNQSIGDMVKDLSPQLENYCFVLCRQSGSGNERWFNHRDLMQETVVKLLLSSEVLQLISSSSDRLKWAKKVAKNQFFDWIRRSGKHTEIINYFKVNKEDAELASVVFNRVFKVDAVIETSDLLIESISAMIDSGRIKVSKSEKHLWRVMSLDNNVAKCISELVLTKGTYYSKRSKLLKKIRNQVTYEELLEVVERLENELYGCLV